MQQNITWLWVIFMLKQIPDNYQRIYKLVNGKHILPAHDKYDDGKFDYINGIAQRKQELVDNINFIWKERQLLDEAMV